MSVNWTLMDIERGTFITRSIWKSNPMPAEAIDRVNALERADAFAHEQYAGDQPPLGDEQEHAPAVGEDTGIQPAPIGNVVGTAPAQAYLPDAVEHVEDDDEGEPTDISTGGSGDTESDSEDSPDEELSFESGALDVPDAPTVELGSLTAPD